MYIFKMCLSLTIIFFALAFPIFSQDYLKTDGQQIVNENGDEIIFRGIGLGGWMLQEGYMLGTTGPQHELEVRMEELIGSEKKNEFYDAWLSNHVRKIDIDSMASWGYNLVRLPMHYKLFTPPIEEEVEGEITWIDKGFEMTDQLLEWCKANNMYLILDLHAAPGGQGENADISDYDPSKPSLWESEANQEKTVALWRKLAERYKDEPMLAGYDIINEPNWGFEDHESDPNGCAESKNTPLWELQQNITEAIREVDQNHMVIIEGNCWGNNYNGLPELWDDNLVISFHKYWNPNTQDAIQGMLNMREERNVPIWLGETGENSNTWFTNAIELFESNDIGWAWWPLKKLGYNNPLQIKRNSGYEDILAYWNDGEEKPTEADAYEALMQLTEDLKLENNIYHKDVVDAKIRQPHTDETIPFKQHHISPDGENIVYATDYDLGKNGFAYFDQVAQNTTGNAGGETWNNGYSYRNDGVDIESSNDEQGNGYNVGWTEDEEWLTYTIEVEEAGNYKLHIRTASTNSSGQISLFSDDTRITDVITLPNTEDYQAFENTTIEDVYLKEGKQTIKLLIETGGFNFNLLQWEGPYTATAQPEILEKKATHQKKKIKLIFNQAFQEIPEDHGFTLTKNGAEEMIMEVELEENVPQQINLLTENTFNYHDELLVSYSGDEISTISGIVLDPFSNEEVNIELEGGIVPHEIPGRIRAEDFITNSGFELEETEDSGGGNNLGHTDVGDYTEYMVDVTETADYVIKYRISSQSNGGALELKSINASEETILIDEVEFDATGGWQNWNSVEGNEISLEKGLHKFRLEATASLFNINWFEFNKVEDIETPTANLKPVKDDLFKVFPNPANSSFTIEFEGDIKHHEIKLHNLKGELILDLSTDQSTLKIQKNLAPGVYMITVTNSQFRSVKKLLIH